MSKTNPTFTDGAVVRLITESIAYGTVVHSFQGDEREMVLVSLSGDVPDMYEVLPASSLACMDGDLATPQGAETSDVVIAASALSQIIRLASGGYELRGTNGRSRHYTKFSVLLRGWLSNHSPTTVYEDALNDDESSTYDSVCVRGDRVSIHQGTVTGNGVIGVKVDLG